MSLHQCYSPPAIIILILLLMVVNNGNWMMLSISENVNCEQLKATHSSSVEQLNSLSKDTFDFLLNSKEIATLNITMYLGGNNESIYCGYLMESACKYFINALNSFNSTLFEKYSNFVLLENVKRNVHIKMIVLPTKNSLCKNGIPNLYYSENLFYFLEMTSVEQTTIHCEDPLKAIIIPSETHVVYLNNLRFENVFILYYMSLRRLNILMERCVLLDGIVTSIESGNFNSKSQFFIIEKTILNGVTNGMLIKNVENLYLLESKIGFYFIVSDIERAIIMDTEWTVFLSVIKTITAQISGCKFTFLNFYLSDNILVKESTSLFVDSEQVHISAQTGNEIRIIDCISQRGNQFLAVYSFKSVTIQNLSVVGSSESSTKELEIISISSCVNTMIYSTNFHKGCGYIGISTYSRVFIDNCSFSNRKQVEVEKLMVGSVLEGVVKVTNSKFSNSKSDLGSIVIIQGYVLEITNCSFENNVASKSGGSIYIGYIDGLVSVVGNRFLNNSVQFEEYPTSGTPSYGGGGVITIEEFSGDYSAPIEFIDNQFIGNFAKRGGVFFFGPKSHKISVKSCLFENNTALLTGSISYFGYRNNLMTLSSVNSVNNQAGLGGEYFEVVTLTNATIEDELSNSEGFFEMSIGKSYNVSIFGIDMDGKQVCSFDERFSIESQHENLIVQFEYQYETIIQFKFYFITDITKDSDIQKLFGMESSIIIKNSLNSISLPITIVDCDKGYSIEKSPTEKVNIFLYECKLVKEFPVELYVAIAVGSSVALFLFGILIGLVSYCTYQTIKKLNRLKKKERAEEKMENKLIEKRIVFNLTEEEEEEKSSSLENENSYREFSGSELKASLINTNQPKRKRKFFNDNDLPSFIIPIEEIEILKKIGEGGAANVFLAKWLNINVAIKSLKNDISVHDFEDEEFAKESAVLSRLRHPNVLVFYGVCLTEKTRYIVTEYLENGSLEKFIVESRKKKLDNEYYKTCLSILIGVANGMSYLHSSKPAIIHRDLKPDNILLDFKNNPKVSDFGLVKILNNSINSQMTKQIGTLYFMSPESFINDHHQVEHKEEATKVDVYSFAIIMWQLFFRATPFQYITNSFKIPPLVLNGQRPDIPFSIENDFEIEEWLCKNTEIEIEEKLITSVRMYFKLTISCWSQQPMCRPSFSVICSNLNNIQNFFQK